MFNLNLNIFNNIGLNYNKHLSFFFYWVFSSFFFVYYNEHNKNIFGTKLGITKVKTNFFFIKSNKYLLRQFDFNNLLKLNKLYFNDIILINIIRNIIFGNKGQYKIIGRGFKSLKKSNALFLKLGYPITFFFSHSIFYRIWIKKKSKTKLLSFKHKHKYFYKLYGLGIFKQKLNLDLSKIQFFRLPDIYCKKGIFLRGKKVYFKEGKKAFSL
jgi:ribosomal protein L6P/L9E